jgi:hypothetical protein
MRASSVSKRCPEMASVLRAGVFGLEGGGNYGADQGRKPSLRTRALGYHAERPGYRISELQISPTQQVPWHCHSYVQDTFYVIEGTSGSSCAHPRRRCSSAPAIPIQSDRAARTSSPMLGIARQPSSCFRVSASTITFRSCSKAAWKGRNGLRLAGQATGSARSPRGVPRPG